MGKTSRRKGYMGEYNARKLLEKFKPVWQAEDPHKPDLNVGDYDIEVKYRKTVPKSVYDWINEKDADILLMKRVKQGESNERLAVIRVEELKKLLSK